MSQNIKKSLGLHYFTACFDFWCLLFGAHSRNIINNFFLWDRTCMYGFWPEIVLPAMHAARNAAACARSSRVLPCSAHWSFIRFYIKYENTFQTQQKKETITNLRALSCHIWGKNWPWHTGPDFHCMSCKNLPLSKMVDCYKREAWALGTSTLISMEEAHFHGGG